MICLLVMLVGVYDIMNLVGIAAINASMSLFGYAFEVMNSYRKEAGYEGADWLTFYFGCFAGIAPWF